MSEAPKPPRCPSCAEEDVESEVLLVEHGYYLSPVHWDETIGDWVTDPNTRAQTWNGDESYWQCNTCYWQGGDPIGLFGDEEEGDDA